MPPRPRAKPAAALDALDIRHVIDLRGPGERDAAPASLLEEKLGMAVGDQCLVDVTGGNIEYLVTAFATIDFEAGTLDAYFERAGWDAGRRAAQADRLAA